MFYQEQQAVLEQYESVKQKKGKKEEEKVEEKSKLHSKFLLFDVHNALRFSDTLIPLQGLQNCTISLETCKVDGKIHVL